MQAKELPVGETFCMSNTAEVLRRVTVNFYLPSLSEWGRERGVGFPSRDHIFAINENHCVRAIHPDNSVERA